MSNKSIIVGGMRTPIGSFLGSLSKLSAVELGAMAIRGVIDRTGVKAEQIQEVIMGCVLPAGLKQGPARQASLHAGLPVSTGATTVNKLCGSGMKAVMLANDTILAGSDQLMVAGGMESMSNAPYLLPKARSGFYMGHKGLQDHMFLDGLEDAYSGKSMGVFAQAAADEYGLTREQMDNYAIESLSRANAAITAGILADEIVPAMINDRIIAEDEQPRKAKSDKIPCLKPAFKEGGTITAANASSISDGASALLLVHEDKMGQYGFRQGFRIVAQATHSQQPAEFTVAPIGAIEKVLVKASWQQQDVDLYEVNEAFAMVTMLAIKQLKLDPAKVNIYGGACAQGHPIGSTGSRLLVTLMNALIHTGQSRGIAALCIGGGEATAVAIEKVIISGGGE